MSCHVLLAGSERRHPKNSVAAGPPAPDEIIRITLVLRRNEGADVPDIELNRENFAETHGARVSDIEAVKSFASKHQFSEVQIHPGARSFRLAGPLGKLAEVFKADIRLSQVEDEIYRTRQGSLAVPEDLCECVVAVLGFDERPAASTSRRIVRHSASSSSYTPTEVARFYNFPAGTGAGQTIALIELDGGYRGDDLQSYWERLGLTGVSVAAIGIDGAANTPAGDPDSADGEVALDIEVAGAVAPGASIAVYFASNTDAGFLNAINSAIHDNLRRPSVISISWGAAEREWTGQAMNAFQAAFHDAALLGITVCAAAGDDGSSDGEEDGFGHVDFPASSPCVLACGGTRLIGKDGRIQSETVWNDGTSGGATGGGVSSHFSKPEYQAHLPVPAPIGTVNSTGRGVPDVAGVADPQTGYRVFVDGQDGVVGGTSAVAPLWAALIALCNAELGRNIGWLHPVLYGTASQQKVFHDITSGTNGAYQASKGWDCCTGLGTPDGTALLSLLKKTIGSSNL